MTAVLKKIPGEQGDEGTTLPVPAASDPTASELRILVLAPTSNDARLTVGFLQKAGLEAAVCSSMAELFHRLEEDCGALLLAEEALADDSVRLLVARLETQPSWSDLPLVIITGTGDANLRHERLASFGPVGNLSLIERPVRPDTLVSTFEFALRSRRRQYQVRALLREREEMSAKAQQNARIFDTTLSSIPDFTYIFNRAGRFIYANKSLLDLWGKSLNEILGKDFFDLEYPTDLAVRLQDQIQQVFETGAPIRDETPYTSPTGAGGYYEYIFSPVLGPNGAVEVVAGSTRDTSERRKNEEALRAADRRKDEFLAMLAHELRNPLASVASAAALLKTSPDPEQHAWAAGVIERQSQQLAHLIDDLLDVSRITNGKIRLRKEVLDGALALDRACDSARPLISERGHELRCDYPRGLWLEADPTRLEQIILNLLTNAAKYTPAGGQIELSARRQGNSLIVSVRDNGMGIAPHRLPEMFELFAQGERSIARSEGGLGIGLTIVRKLAELHGGRVEAQSEGANRGSTFTVFLPSVPPRVEPFLPGVPSAEEEVVRQLRILIVDDNVDTAQGLSRLLARTGHEMAVAHDGHQALRLAREFEPHAVVLDIGLPGMDGFEVARRLRAEGHGAKPLIVAVTGYGQEEDRARAIEAGFDHHLVKPVEMDELKRFLSGVR